MNAGASFSPHRYPFLTGVPRHWDVVPFRRLFSESPEVNGPEPTGPMLSVSGYRGVERKIYDSENRRRSPEELETYRVVRPGQLAVNTMWMNYAGLGVSELTGHMSPAYRAYNISSELDPRFVHHLMRSSAWVSGYTAHATGVRPNSLQLSRHDLMSFPVLVPPRLEQRAIAEYLDHETDEIDAFIADQELYSTLIAERQRALKFSLATGQLSGLASPNSEAAMWGAIPNHWSVQKLNWHFDVGNGSTPKSDEPRYWSEDGIPWVNSSVVNEDLVLEPSRHVTTDALREAHLPIVRSGSLVIGLTGQGKTRGSVTTLGIDTTINQHLAYLTPRKNSSVTAPFLRLALEAAYSELRNLSDGIGGTKGALTCEVVQSFRIPVPPLEEQEVLVARNREDQAKVNEMLTDARLAIGLAKERRAALISAAVAGQIDVTQPRTPVAEQLEEEVLQNT